MSRFSQRWLLVALAVLARPVQSARAQETVFMHPGYAGDLLSTLEGSFERISVQEGLEERLSGHFWFFDKSKMLLEVDEPTR